LKATEVIAGLAESNGSLLPGLWRDLLHVTCGLNACTPGSAARPMLGNEYGKTLPFSILYSAVHCLVLVGQDGTERNIESISLIDAVLPEVIEQRKQGALKGAQLKVEAHGPNGDEGAYDFLLCNCVL